MTYDVCHFWGGGKRVVLTLVNFKDPRIIVIKAVEAAIEMWRAFMRLLFCAWAEAGVCNHFSISHT